ncbi:MAG: FkbM family methyltransferase [Candidatus Puniceispirillaceae bacterium]
MTRFEVTRFGVARFEVTGIPFGCTNTVITEFVICPPFLVQAGPLSMIHSIPILSNADYSLGQKIRWLRLLWRTLQDRRLYRVADAILAQSTVKAPVVLDIGANVGAFTRAFVKAGRRPRLVLAFEPSSYVFSILQIVTKRMHQVQCHKIALSSAAGTVDLQTPIKASGSLRVGLSYIGAAGDTNTLTETVPAQRLDDFLADRQLDSIDVVKMDVEGAEQLVLDGAPALLKQVRPIWYVEIDESRAQRFGDSAQMLFATFTGNGYKAYHFDDEFNLQPASGIDAASDYLFVPN